MTHDPYDIPVSGLVLDEDRGSLPYRLIHGEALVAAAAWAVGAAGVDLLDQTGLWDAAADRGTPLLLHDALCPLTPPEFLAACVERCLDDDAVVVGVRAVTDTVKEVAGGLLGATIDRDGLVAVCSPVVLPPAAVADLAGAGGLPTTDLVALVTWLRASYPVVLVDAPPTARRVASDDDLRILEALSAPG